MEKFIQFAILGFGSGAAYALFAQGAVLIYRGSGIVNFAHGSLGMLTAYLCFVTLHHDHQLNLLLSAVIAVVFAGVVAVAFQLLVLRALRNAAAIVRLISTLGLFILIQAAVELKYGSTNVPVKDFLPTTVHKWGDRIAVNEKIFWLFGIAALVTLVMWSFTRFTRVGLAITASAQNERAVQTMGWSPQRLAVFTWGAGGALAGLAGVLIAPNTGLNTGSFTSVVLAFSLAAALLGGFESFPITLLGGVVVGVGESLATGYKRTIEGWLHQTSITGLPRAVPFLAILLVLVVRGRSLPLRSHVADRLPKLGTGRINVRGVLLAALIILVLLFTLFDDRWAVATSTTLIAAVMILSVVVLTGYAGQLSLGQWALAGLGTLFAGQLVLHGWPRELAIPAGILLTIPAGLVFALPALRTRGVNLAVVTLGLGFTVFEVVFANARFVGDVVDGGTVVATLPGVPCKPNKPCGPTKLLGIQVDNTTHPHRWAVVCLIGLVATALMVANLRRSATGRRLIAVRTNERAAASLGISVFRVKLYAFGAASGIAALAGILYGFQFNTITYTNYNPIQSVFSVGWAVIGGLGYVVGAAFGSPNAGGGLGARVFGLIDFHIGSTHVHLGGWAVFIGGIILLAVLIGQPDGVAAVVSERFRSVGKRLHLLPRAHEHSTDLPEHTLERVAPATLAVEGLTVRYGGVTAAFDVTFAVKPGEVVGLIGPNGAGKTTIIDAVTGFTKAASGVIRFEGEEIQGWSASRRSRLGLRRSFQSLELFEDLSVADNIRAGADDHPSLLRWVTDLFIPRSQRFTNSAVAAIHEFDLVGSLAKLPGELPYGQRRLVGIARAVASSPSVLMLDEPAAGLDETESRELAHLIRRLADERGMGVLLVEHDVGLVMSICDRIVVIEFGQVIAAGTPAEIRDNPVVKHAYLGTDEEEVISND